MAKKQSSSDENAILGMILCMVPIVGVASVVMGTNPALSLTICGVFAGLALAATYAKVSVTKPILGVSLIGQCVALTSSFAGHSWQIDSHMAFFAALAMLVLLRDIPTILAATAAIALHHLSVSIMFPVLVYPSLDVADNLMRTGFHAVIVVAEAAILCVAIYRQNKLVSTVEAQMAEIDKAADAERITTAEREISHMEQKEAVAALSTGLEALAQGDLTVRLDANVDGEFAMLQRNFNTSLEQLQTILQGVVSTSEAISRGSNGLASAADQLAQRTEQQAASLAETTATISEIKGSVDDTAKNSDDANTLASATRSLADDGKKVVAETVVAMDEIAKGSNAISQIISTIDDIAFQTNLLALNAGVEAARAGEAGRGFAVVASEVRALAQRAGEAAKEITDLIRKSQDQVTGGVELTGKANEALMTISEQVDRVSEAVAEISSATKSQAVGISEINSAMANLDNLTQQNAAMVEETTAASTELDADASELRSSASVLKIDTRSDGYSIRQAS